MAERMEISELPELIVDTVSPSLTTDMDTYIKNRYECMLSTFTLLDLQKILLAFGCSRLGKKHTLLRRAIHLISFPPNSFNLDDYLSTIGETYLMKFTLGRVASPQRIPIISKCIYSEFYDIVSTIHQENVLIGQIDHFLSRTLRRRKIEFSLSEEQFNSIMLSNEKNEYIHQVHIQVSQIHKGLEKIDCLPGTFFLTINNQMYSLPHQIVFKGEPNAPIKKLLKPIDCTKFIKLHPTDINEISVHWIPDEQDYILELNFVKKLNINNVLMKLLRRDTHMSIEESKNNIFNIMTRMHTNFQHYTSYYFSLICPLSKKRIRIPVRSFNCHHIQCFDAKAYILINDKRSSWKCPICDKFCFYDDLQIDFYFFGILSNYNLMKSKKEIEILSNKKWRVLIKQK